MRSTIIERPYHFIPPHRGNWIPSLIQFSRLTDHYLRHYEGITTYDVRGLDRLQASLEQNHGVLLAPNHCRYADPIAIGWVARAAKVNVYAMASWHLFNQHWLQSLSIRWCGGFSIYREGNDRHSLETAIDALVQAKRPLIVFPEGTVSRSNDVLQPLLEGVGFLARSAARRRLQRDRGKVVIHPVGIKYIFRGDLEATITPLLRQLEQHCKLTTTKPQTSSVDRLLRLNAAILSTQEADFGLPGHEHSGSEVDPSEAKFSRVDAISVLAQRRGRLMEHLLTREEAAWLAGASQAAPMDRVRRLRAALGPRLVGGKLGSDERTAVLRSVYAVDVAQELATTPADYLRNSTATRQLEVLARLEENAGRKATVIKPIQAILEIGEPISITEVNSQTSGSDNAQVKSTGEITAELTQRLSSMLADLSLLEQTTSAAPTGSPLARG